MKKLLLIVSCIFSTFLMQAQIPPFQWVVGMGGMNNTNDEGNSIALDALGNVYTMGSFQGTSDFDPGVAIYTLSSAGGNDIFISKLDAAGNFIWAKSYGGEGDDYGASMIIEASGNITVTGYFTGTVDFDPGAGIFNLISVGSTDIFISKLDASGNFIWAKGFGGTGFDASSSIVIDAVGNLYLTGLFKGTVDFDPSIGSFTLTSAGYDDIFISKLDALGNFVWAKNIGGEYTDNGNSISVDAFGNIYAVGLFQGTVDFDPGVNTFTLTSVGNSDIFILKLDASGNFVWAKGAGGLNIDAGGTVNVDNSGNVLTTGSFQETVDFDTGAGIFNLTSSGGYDIFILKLDASGNFVWAKNMGGTSIDFGQTSILDGNGNIYTAGYFYGTSDFDPGIAIFNLTSLGFNDFFISKLDASGNFVWAENIGGTGNDVCNSIAIEASGNLYSTGSFQGTVDFDASPGLSSLTSGIASSNVFVLKLSQAVEGIGELKNNYKELKIYPNPSNGLFAIDIIENSQISITNTLGQIILSERRSHGKQFFNLQDAVSGIYFVSVATAKEQNNFKIVKE